MLSWLRKKSRLITLDNTHKTMKAEPGETILQAALRDGIRFPHSCRVGGCGACKCQLQKGQVKELTESAYVLSSEELDSGYILACQSIPRSDVSILLPDWDDQSPGHSLQNITGTVTAQRFLTHDITAITVGLDKPLKFTAGQYAHLSLLNEYIPARAYSFASTCGEQGEKNIEFFIRSIDGGALSPRFRDPAICGTRVNIEGPSGDFWLRPDDSPILAMAGGSGLAPLLSILRQALKEKSSRPVTLLFGARTQADLYALNDIAQLKEQWGGAFEFIPVLSDEAENSDWHGMRGLVTDAIEGHIRSDSQVYLCGPAAMIDSAISECQKFSVRPTQIFFDKFSDSRDLAAIKQRASA